MSKGVIMCKYCNKKDDVSMIFNKELKLGALGSEYLSLSLDSEKSCFYISFGESEYTKNIKYCPMCGRLL